MAPEPSVTLFLCGDVMVGRGIDQILPHPVSPRLHEPYVKDARDYVALAERRSGRIPREVDWAYVWGSALDVLKSRQPDKRIINLETSITASEDSWPGKGIHYRMHPQNAGCIGAAGIDCCVLANNHVLDWGYAGLTETVAVLRDQGIKLAGAGASESRAAAPAELPSGTGNRILIFAYTAENAGTPREWRASAEWPGVNLLSDFSQRTIKNVSKHIDAHAFPEDIVIFSVHWGGNWGFDIPEEHTTFARALIDTGSVDIVYGHSSHHVRPVEIYNDKLILYGCGDFINDYEGIGSEPTYRDDLTLMYFPSLNPESGSLQALEMVPLRMQKFSLQSPSEHDVAALHEIVNRESMHFRTPITRRDDSLWARGEL